ncbi:hypothetical protein [Labilibacter marinus]|uniref:hypothetical protein n=1 Tax=Labilibacter marinus TaxID=1477105 RepID=UPI00094F49DC|nr:hypothetical protein [Labilibacter marinus]
MKTNNIILLLGMHRSGTSLLAKWLHHCGLNIGENLLGADMSNSTGHYEDMDFLNTHINILESHNLPYKVGTETKLKLTKNDISQLKQNIDSKIKKNKDTYWGWKEPRTCLFLNEYNRLVPKAFPIVIYRNHKEVVDSLYRRDFRWWNNKPLTQRIRGKLALLYRRKRLLNLYLSIWIRHNEEIIKYLDNKSNYLVLDNYDLFDNDMKITSFLKKKINVNSIVENPISSVYKKGNLQQRKYHFNFSKKYKKQVLNIYEKLGKYREITLTNLSE